MIENRESQTNALREGVGTATTSSSEFYFSPSFLVIASKLRAQFESRISECASGATTPFSFAFRQGAYAFLCSSAERVFAEQDVAALLDALASWSLATLGPCRISTPQARLYMGGCWRSLARDQIAAKWRYQLSLTMCPRLQKNGGTRVLLHTERSSPYLQNVLNFPFEFNRLLVHRCQSPYSVVLPKVGIDPREGTLLLEGYLW